MEDFEGECRRWGRNVVSSPPVFSTDLKYILVCKGLHVSVFDTKACYKDDPDELYETRILVHEAPVTSVIIVPASQSECWTSSLAGTIKHWDFLSRESMKTINIQHPVHSMVIPSLLSPKLENNEIMYAYISVAVPGNEQSNQRRESSGQILKCNISLSCLDSSLTLSKLLETKDPQKIAISTSGRYFGILDGSMICVCEVPIKEHEDTTYRMLKLQHDKKLSCIAFHPKDRVVAAGDVTGTVLLWKDFSNGDGVTCTNWMWHSSEVKVLSFSSDGAFLFSGGAEGVLVLWKVDTGQRRLLPNMGAPLRSFVSPPNGHLSAVSCADNRIRVMQRQQMEIWKWISGKEPAEMCRGPCNGFVFNHVEGLVAGRPENYDIIFHNLSDGREISKVQLCEPSDGVTIVLNLVALSFNGSVMCTAETVKERLKCFERLRFWNRGSSTNDYNFSETIDRPHSWFGVSAIACNFTGDKAVSAAYGGQIKVWVRKPLSQQDANVNQRAGWELHYCTGSYAAVTAAAFANDDSVFAIAMETGIKLIDIKNKPIAIIKSTHERIVNLSFSGDSKFLVAASQGAQPQLLVWDRPKGDLCWCYKLNTEAIACSGEGSCFAALVLPESSKADGAILLFNAGERVPVGSWVVTKAKGGGLAFIQTPDAKLAYVNGDNEYAVFDPWTGQSGYASAEAVRPMKRSLESIFSVLPLESLLEEQTGMEWSTPKFRQVGHGS